MGAGGIIQQRAAAMLPAITDSSMFDGLPQHCKDKINAIDGKAFADRTEQDVQYLAAMFQLAVHC